MTSAPLPNPAQPAHHRPEGTPVADDSVPHTLPDTPTSTRTGNTADGSVWEPAVSVWTTAQTSPAAQRKGCYVADSTAHPAKMLPAVAAHAIAHYTQPGDLVLDPMCGIGTTLVEAVHAGRRAVGEIVPRGGAAVHVGRRDEHDVGGVRSLGDGERCCEEEREHRGGI